MAEPIDRGTFAGARIQTQAAVVEGQALFFVDVHAPTDDQSVTIGWSPDRSLFGVYVNGKQVYPALSPLDVGTVADVEPPDLDPDDLITDETP